MAFLLCADATGRFERNLVWRTQAQRGPFKLARMCKSVPSEETTAGFCEFYRRHSHPAAVCYYHDCCACLGVQTWTGRWLDARNCHVSMPFRSCLRKARLQGSQSVSRWTSSGPLCCGIEEVRRCCHIECLTLASLSTSISCLPVVGFGLTGSLQLHEIKLLRLLPSTVLSALAYRIWHFRSLCASVHRRRGTPGLARVCTAFILLRLTSPGSLQHLPTVDT